MRNDSLSNKMHPSNLVLLCCYILIVSCTNKNNPQFVSGEAQVQIAQITPEGAPEFQTVKIEGLVNLKEMRGEYGQFFLSPKISSEGLSGSPFSGHYSKMSHVWIARDTMSLAASTLYYHLQELWKQLSPLGLDQTRPKLQQVALFASLKEASNKTWINNAAFDQMSGGLLISPFNLNHEPLIVNGGVLAHEYFHSIFYFYLGKYINDIYLNSSLTAHDSIVFDSDTKHSKEDPTVQSDSASKLQIYHRILLRGLNEGLADLWGFLYSKDENFIQRSLGQETESRSLNIESSADFVLPGKVEVSEFVTHVFETDRKSWAALTTQAAYKVGTSWARFFRRHLDLNSTRSENTGNQLNSQKKQSTQSSSSSQYSKESLNKFRKALIQSLIQFRQKILATNISSQKLETLDLKDFLELFIQNETLTNLESCNWIAKSYAHIESNSFKYTCVEKNGAFILEKEN